jgi:hypothetical protein
MAENMLKRDKARDKRRIKKKEMEERRKRLEPLMKEFIQDLDGMTPEDMPESQGQGEVIELKVLQELRRLSKALPVVPIARFKQDYKFVKGDEFRRMQLNAGNHNVEHIIDENEYPVPQMEGLDWMGEEQHLMMLKLAFKKAEVKGVENYVEWVNKRHQAGVEYFPQYYQRIENHGNDNSRGSAPTKTD